MRTATKVVVLSVLAVVLFTVPGSAEDESERELGRWGIGWDNGLGGRYRLTPGWELGFRLSGDLDDFDHEEHRQLPDTTVTETVRTAGGSIGMAVLLFYSQPINDWIRFGPYFGVVYSHSSDHSRAGTYYDLNQNDVGIELGARPSFTLWKRFVFESRIGVSYTHSHQVQERRYADANITDRVDGWVLRSFGQNLGLNALMQFMIYF